MRPCATQARTSDCLPARSDACWSVRHDPRLAAINGAAGSDELDGPAHEIGNCVPHLFDEAGLARAVNASASSPTPAPESASGDNGAVRIRHGAAAAQLGPPRCGPARTLPPSRVLAR